LGEKVGEPSAANPTISRKDAKDRQERKENRASRQIVGLAANPHFFDLFDSNSTLIFFRTESNAASWCSQILNTRQPSRFN
jgi:hypothetical protein